MSAARPNLKLENATFLGQKNEVSTTSIGSYPSWDQGGIIFVSSARQRETTAKLQEPGWGHIQGGKMTLGSQAGGGMLLS